MIHIAILDDHPMVLKGLESMLMDANGIIITTTCGNSKELLDYLTSNNIDVLLLDINLPDGNGIELCGKITKDYPQIAVIGVSNYSETSFIRNMMKNGAKGYLLKNTTRDELLNAIHTVYNGKNYLPEKIKTKLLDESFGLQTFSFIPKLTRREKEVLKCISNELTTHEIAEKLFISIRTVESHRKNLLQKLNVRNTAGLIKEAFVKGLLK